MIEDLKNIIIWLKTIISEDFYIWVPQEVPSQLFITLNVVTQIQNVAVNNRTRVEFRIIWTTQNNLLELDEIQNQILNYIKNNYRNLWFYNYEIWTYSNWYDENKRPIILRDFIFYKIT